MATLYDIVTSSNKTIIDVRSIEEFHSGHIEGAIHIPLQDLKEKIEEIKAMPQPVVVYCLSGGRSAVAAHLLQQAGLTDVYNGGGIGNMQMLLM